jgi:hypothetical protein
MVTSINSLISSILFFRNVPGTTCLSCAAGTYSSGTGITTSAACASCAAGTYSRAGFSACNACPANSNSAAGASQCKANAGFYDLGASLLAYYAFNPDNFLGDSSGLLGALSNTGQVAWAAGTLSGWAGGNQNVAYLSQPNGVSGSTTNLQYLSLPGITVPASLTICAWYYPITAGKWHRIFDFGTGAPSNNILAGQNVNTGNLEIHAYVATSWSSLTFTNGWTTNTWQHFCGVISGKSIVGYYNGMASGTLVSEVAFAGYAYPADTAWIGRSHWVADDLYKGYIDEFRVYNRALSAAEVTAIYNFRGDTYTVTSPLACAAGTYSTGTGMTSPAACTSCPHGSYQALSGGTVCSLCSAGSYQTGTGITTSASCLACAAGTYQTGTGITTSSWCLACVAGTYQTGTGITTSGSCLACVTDIIISASCIAFKAVRYQTGSGITASASLPFWPAWQAPTLVAQASPRPLPAFPPVWQAPRAQGSASQHYHH